MNDGIHFEVKDFAGRTIVCTLIQWEDHVLGPSHRYMEGAEKEVIQTLQTPDNNVRYLDRSPKYPNRRVYYKKTHFDYYIKVVVEYADKECNGIGYLFTAYMPDSIPPGEIPEI